MHHAKRVAPVRPLAVFASVAALLLILAVASPGAVLAGDEDYKGWFLALDLATTQPNGLNQDVATVVDFSSLPYVQSRLIIKNDADATFEAGFGFSWGEGLGGLKVSYWSFDNEDETTGAAFTGLYPNVFGYGYNYGGVYLSDAAGVPFQAISQVKATTATVDYVRPVRVGDRTVVNWILGLRVASYEENVGLLAADAIVTALETKRWESSAWGPRVGVSSSFEFGDHFRLQAGLAISFMQADTEAIATQTVDATLGDVRVVQDDNLRGEIRDYDARAVWSYGALEYYLGYSGSVWDGLVADPLPAPSCCGFVQTGGRQRESIGFNSVHAGIVWRPGRPR